MYWIIPLAFSFPCCYEWTCCSSAITGLRNLTKPVLTYVSTLLFRNTYARWVCEAERSRCLHTCIKTMYSVFSGWFDTWQNFHEVAVRTKSKKTYCISSSCFAPENISQMPSFHIGPWLLTSTCLQHEGLSSSWADLLKPERSVKHEPDDDDVDVPLPKGLSWL